jgi:hypothetical protein
MLIGGNSKCSSFDRFGQRASAFRGRLHRVHPASVFQAEHYWQKTGPNTTSQLPSPWEAFAGGLPVGSFQGRKAACETSAVHPVGEIRLLSPAATTTEPRGFPLLFPFFISASAEQLAQPPFPRKERSGQLLRMRLLRIGLCHS